MILVTGGTGTIGSELLRLLSRAGGPNAQQRLMEPDHGKGVETAVLQQLPAPRLVRSGRVLPHPHQREDARRILAVPDTEIVISKPLDRHGQDLLDRGAAGEPWVAVAVLEDPLEVEQPRNDVFLNWELRPGKGHGIEANLALIAMAVACLIAGGGALAIDSLIAR